jgi:hypothetical protein
MSVRHTVRHACVRGARPPPYTPWREARLHAG